jgi:Fe-S cluster biogenesis protein NfuA
MFIQTETTPNPQTLKFIPGVTVLETGTHDFRNADAASISPLAAELFKIAGVSGVFLGSDFITITKAEGYEWDVLKPGLLMQIMEHFVAGKPVIRDGAVKADAGHGELGEIEQQIVELIETRVRPAVAMDGGDIIYKGFEDGIVLLELHGACSGCPSSTATLKSGIENMLKHYVPEVVAVEAVN